MNSVRIALEGIDGAGKSSLALKLRAMAMRFKLTASSSNLPSLFWRDAEPNSLALSKLSNRTSVIDDYDPEVASIIAVAVLIGDFNRMRRTLLDSGNVFIYDRHRMSIMVRSHFDGVSLERARIISELLPAADITFLLDADPEECYRRKVKNNIPINYAETKNPFIDETGSLSRSSFIRSQTIARETYLHLAREASKTFASVEVVDANQSQQTMLNSIEERLENLLRSISESGRS
jgi:thymidylate kinase